MQIKIEKTFRVDAPIEDVWALLTDPEQVVSCLPGAELDEVVDERNFLGSIKVQVGAVTTSYTGKITLTEVDEAAYTVLMAAEGRETGGGTAKGSLSSRLKGLSDGRTEVAAEANIELTGSIMRVGRGMIEGVSKQLFQQFVANAKARLETADGAADAAAPEAAEPIRLVPLVFGVIGSSVAGFFRRLFGQSKS